MHERTLVRNLGDDRLDRLSLLLLLLLLDVDAC